MKKVFLRYILPILGVIAIVLLDQWVKELCLDKIGMYNTVVLIEDVFEFHVIPNYGMAWGMLQNCQWLFIAITPVVLFLLGLFYVKLPKEKKFNAMRILSVMLAGGAVGNLLDRMFRGEFGKGYVVDMFYVKAIDFPIFNVADCFVSVAFIALVFFVLFVYSEEDFDRMFHLGKKKAKAQNTGGGESVKEVKKEASLENKKTEENVEVK